MSSQDNIDSRQIADRGGRILNFVNQPLPWICLFALIVIVLTAFVFEMRGAMKSELAQAKAAALVASIKAESANQRITDSISSQAQVQTAYEQTLKYYTGEVVKSQTETRMLEYYANELTVAAKQAQIVPSDYSFAKFQQQYRGK